MPTEIWTTTDLDNVRTNLAGDYILMNDIDLAGAAWTPIAEWAWPPWSGDRFTGSLNGQGYTIEGLSDTLFGVLSGAKIHDLNVRGDIAWGEDPYKEPSLGALFAREIIGNGCEIDRCSAVGVITFDDAYFGAVEMSGVFVGVITDYDGAGDGTTINNCYARGELTLVQVSNSSWAVGGFVGGAYPGDQAISINNSYAAVVLDVGGGAGPFGGFCGEDGGATIDGCYYDSDVSGQSDTGKGIPRTTAEMTYPAASNTYEGWNFTSIWRHDTAYTINAGYPYLYAVEITFAVHSKISAAWKSGPAWIKKDGQWKSVTDGWIKEGGVWKPIIP